MGLVEILETIKWQVIQEYDIAESAIYTIDQSLKDLGRIFGNQDSIDLADVSRMLFQSLIKYSLGSQNFYDIQFLHRVIMEKIKENSHALGQVSFENLYRDCPIATAMLGQLEFLERLPLARRREKTLALLLMLKEEIVNRARTNGDASDEIDPDIPERLPGRRANRGPLGATQWPSDLLVFPRGSAARPGIEVNRGPGRARSPVAKIDRQSANYREDIAKIDYIIEENKEINSLLRELLVKIKKGSEQDGSDLSMRVRFIVNGSLKIINDGLTSLTLISSHNKNDYIKQKISKARKSTVDTLENLEQYLLEVLIYTGNDGSDPIESNYGDIFTEINFLKEQIKSGNRN